MENASKALIIAGGVLLALIVISALVMVIRVTGDNLKQQDKAVASEQLAKFNMRYKSYEKNVRGIDIRSLMNMADDDNLKDSRQITIKFFVKKDLEGVPQPGATGSEIKDLADFNKWYSNKTNGTGAGTEENPYSFNGIVSDSTKLTNFNKRVFNCTGINYDSSGRISEMKFEEIF